MSRLCPPLTSSIGFIFAVPVYVLLVSIRILLHSTAIGYLDRLLIQLNIPIMSSIITIMYIEISVVPFTCLFSLEDQKILKTKDCNQEELLHVRPMIYNPVAPLS